MTEPRIQQFEGIPMPLKEASLDEYVGLLEPDHLARRELNELRKLALDGAKATAELLEALKKNRELEGRNTDLQNQLSAITSGPEIPTPPNIVQSTDPSSSLPTRLQPSHTHSPCPYCNNPVSIRPGPWAAHFAKYHKDQERPPVPNI